MKPWLSIVALQGIAFSMFFSPMAHADKAEKQRLVTAGGSLTEIVYALNAQDMLVAVDTSSSYPHAVVDIPKLGYFRSLNVEGVLSVKPTQVLLLKGAGPQNVINQLQDIDVNITIIDHPKTLQGLFNTISELGEAIGKRTQAEALSVKLKEALAQIPKHDLSTKKAVFLMSAGERGLVAAGSDTTPHLIFDELNIQNPFSQLNGFKPISAEALATSGTDIIFIASHTTRESSVQELCESNMLSLWASLKGCNLHKIDSLKYLGLTPRLPSAMAEVVNYLSVIE